MVEASAQLRDLQQTERVLSTEKHNPIKHNSNSEFVDQLAHASEAETAQKATYQDVIFEISKLLNTGLSRETVEICTKMIEEQGVNPLALASFIKQATASAEDKSESAQ